MTVITTRSRRDQIRFGDIAADKQGVWVAGEVDDLETLLSAQIEAAVNEMRRIRQVMTGLLVSIILALIVIPTSVFFTR